MDTHAWNRFAFAKLATRKSVVSGMAVFLALHVPMAAHATLTVPEQTAITLSNLKRTSAGLYAAKYSSCLDGFAERHVRDMAVQNRLFHYSSASLTYIMKRCNLSHIGENIANGLLYEAAGAVVNGWMGSPAHRANIMRSNHWRTATAKRYSATGTPYWEALYGTPR